MTLDEEVISIISNNRELLIESNIVNKINNLMS